MIRECSHVWQSSLFSFKMEVDELSRELCFRPNGEIVS